MHQNQVGPNALSIKEAFYTAGNSMLRVVINELNEQYPITLRLATMPLYDESKSKEYDRLLAMARSFLYEQRNLVMKKWLPRFVIARGARIESPANAELKGLLVDGSLDRLHEKLVAYLPLLARTDKVLSVGQTIGNVYAAESKRLTEFLSSYNATFATGIQPIEKELGD